MPSASQQCLTSCKGVKSHYTLLPQNSSAQISNTVADCPPCDIYSMCWCHGCTELVLVNYLPAVELNSCLYSFMKRTRSVSTCSHLLHCRSLLRIIYLTHNIYAGLANAIEDIVTYAAKALIDPRTRNKRVIVCPSANKMSQNDLIGLWERISGKKVTRNFMNADELDKQIQGVRQRPLCITLPTVHPG